LSGYYNEISLTTKPRLCMLESKLSERGTNFIRTKLFQEAGADFPTVDWTWDDLLAMATQLTNDTGDPTTQQWGYLFRRVDLEHMSQSFGGNWVNADEKRCDFTKPETVQALQFFSDLTYNSQFAHFLSGM
jgi:ABC-type glycerol-3-phosphate transport system substrate-binding protein